MKQVIFRSKKFDPRNQGEKLVFPFLIIVALKLLVCEEIYFN